MTAAKPNIPVVPLREAAELLGVSPRAAESALRHAGIRSGYPLAAVEWLASNRPGRGARTDLKETTMATLILKAIRFADYRYNVPDHPLYQTGPDGAWWEDVANLPGLDAPETLAWVQRWTAQRGVRVMAAFTYGGELGQVDTDDSWLAVQVPDETHDEARRAARRSLADHLRTIPGARYDHLVEDPEERARLRDQFLRAAGVDPTT